jgi:ABC-type lipoprotein export system ATPase subunit
MGDENAELTVRALKKSFEGPDGVVKAVDGLDFELRAGEFGALRGSSGCGKTTLLLMCGGLLRPSSGDVELFGTNLYAMNEHQRTAFRAKHIGFVFQQFHLIPYLNVLDNVLAATLASGKRVDAHERARGMLEELGMGGRLRHTPGCLSTGERQRVALARALINRPSLILADEPTGNLDPETSTGIMKLLFDISQSGRSVLMATHNYSLFKQFPSRTLKCEDGKVSPYNPSSSDMDEW